MKGKLQRFLKGEFLITQLMQLYSLLLIGVLSLLIVGFSLFAANVEITNHRNMLNNTVESLQQSIQSKDEIVTNIVSEFVATSAKYENMRNYLLMSPPEYFLYTSEIWSEYSTNIYFPDQLSSLFLIYPDIEEIDIVLDEVDNYYLHADSENNRGIRRVGRPTFSQQLYLFRVIQEPAAATAVGQVYITFSDKNLTTSTTDELVAAGIDTFIFASNGRQLYHNGGTLPELDQEYLVNTMNENEDLDFSRLREHSAVKRLSGKGLSIFVFLNKQKLWLTIIKKIFLIALIGVGSMVVLLLILKYTFRRYQEQLSEIITVTEQVRQGEFEAQVDLDRVQLELKDLATAINQMIVSINRYIEDIYTLEIKQRDAHMQALQAQINPHFLYNTLEYIRMYALSQQQEELADVVYAFSALLRNNTNQAKSISLQSELDFCEKYVYLYQMRYPDNIAYHFVIEESLERLMIPKFTIQPLIENYFVHGIDYGRQDNAISVKAYRQGPRVFIQVRDNGKGITPERLLEVQEELEHPKEKETPRQSVGISNVYQRFKGYFGESCQLEIVSQIGQGVCITISFEYKEGLLDV